MLEKLGRYKAHFAALVVAAGLGATAGALGLGEQLLIMAPTEVVAGNNINGYVVGIEDPCTINAWTWGQGPAGPGQYFLGPQVSGLIEPLWFSYPTIEMMAPGVATIFAMDSDESDSCSVVLK